MLKYLRGEYQLLQDEKAFILIRPSGLMSYGCVAETRQFAGSSRHANELRLAIAGS